MIYRRLKNVSNEIIFINGTGLVPGEYYIIPMNEYHQFISDENLIKNIVLRKIIVNDGNGDITNPIDAWNFLICKNDPPKTSEGYWTFFQKKEYELEISEIFDLTLKRNILTDFLPQKEVSEFITIPSNRTLKLTKLHVNNTYCSVLLKLNYYVKIKDNFYLLNPFIDPNCFCEFIVSKKFNFETDEDININFNNFYNDGHQFNSENYSNSIFLAVDENSEKKYFIVGEFDRENMLLKNVEINFDMNKNQKLTNVSKPILFRYFNRDLEVNFNVPLLFSWYDHSYLKIDMKILNENFPDYYNNDDKNIILNIHGYLTKR